MDIYEYQNNVAMLKGIKKQAEETAEALRQVFDLIVNIQDRKEVIDMGKCGGKKKGRKGGCKGK